MTVRSTPGAEAMQPSRDTIHTALVAAGFVVPVATSVPGEVAHANPSLHRQQPVLVAAGEPLAIVWANPAACALFACTTLESLTAAFHRGSSFASPTLADSRLYLTPDRLPPAPPRLERLRFLIGALPETIAFMVRTLPGPAPLVVFSALDVRSALLARMPVTAPLTLEAPVALAPWNEAPASTPEPAAEPVVETQIATLPSPAPEAEPASPLRSVAAVRADLLNQFGAAAHLRFLWKTDGQGILRELTGQLEACVGATAAHLVDKPFLDTISALQLDPTGKLAAAFASRGTWSRLEVCWPVAQSEAALPISLGALPMFTRTKNFDGYQGYGLIHVQQATLNPRPDSPAAPDPEPTVGVAEPAPAEPTMSAAAAVAIQVDETVAEQPVRKVIPFLAPAARGGFAARPAALPAAAPEATPTSDAPAKVQPTEDTFVAQPDPQRDEPDPTHDTPDAPHQVSLTLGERLAFGEIARTLISGVSFGPTGVPNPPDVRAHDTPAPADVSIAAPDPEAHNPEAPDPKAPALEPTPPAAPAKTSHALELLRRVVQASAHWTSGGETDEAAGEPAAPAIDPLTSRLAALVEEAPVGLLVAQNNRAVFANATLLGWLGFDTLDQCLAPDALIQMFKGRDPAKRIHDNGGPVPLMGHNGEVGVFNVTLTATTWEGAPADLLALTRDPETTPKLQALDLELQKARASNRELHAILDTATDGVAVLDAQGHILSLNKSGQALFGVEQNDVAGAPFTTLLQPEDEALAQAYFEGLKDNGVASMLNDGRNVLGRAQQGGVIPLFITIGRIGGAPAPTFCAVLRDMTAWQRVELDLKEARREAEKVSALKSDFLAKVSHEIRTPLNAILGFAEVMMEERLGEIGNARYKDYLKDIHTSGSHVMSLVNDLLDLSKIEAGKMDLDSLPLDANKIINECVSLMQLQANAERVIVRMSLAQRLPMVLGDERSLRQILLNLLSNAVKFNEPGGQVIVSSAFSDAGSVVLRVRDTGIGMDDADLALALEPFRQVVSARKLTGTGLGLPLTKALVEANRALFNIKSRPREGTLVEVTFPQSRILTSSDLSSPRP